MKKLLKFVLFIPLSSVFLSGFMHKTIQKTITVTEKISLDWTDDFETKDLFGSSYANRVSQKCFNYSLSEKEFDELLSEGVKVVTIQDQSWRQRISFPNLYKDYNNVWQMQFDEQGECIGKRYILEGKENTISKYLSRINDYENKESKYLSNLNSSFSSLEPGKSPRIQKSTYKLQVLKNGSGKAINFILLPGNEMTQMFVLGNNLKRIGQNTSGKNILYYGWFNPAEEYIPPSSVNPEKVFNNIVWTKDNNKYQIIFIDYVNSKEIKTVYEYDYLEE